MNCLVQFDLAFFTQIKPFKIDLFYWIQCVCETAFENLAPFWKSTVCAVICYVSSFKTNAPAKKQLYIDLNLIGRTALQECCYLV